MTGLMVEQSEVTELGLKNDRLFMLVDNDGQFISQRTLPKMGQLKASLDTNTLSITTPDNRQLTAELDEITRPINSIHIWQDSVDAFVANDNINLWLSDFLQTPVKLVRYNFSKPRASDPEFSRPNDTVSFADGFPLLLTNKSSLDDLNDRLDNPVSMECFRPNLVVENAPAYAEDNWKSIQIGTHHFDLVKPCSRCVMTTLDPTTGIKRNDGEPLKTLSTYRKNEFGICFGVNLIPRSSGTISVGDPVTIVTMSK